MRTDPADEKATLSPPVRRRIKIRIALPAVLLASLLGWLLMAPTQRVPVFEGKSLDQWLDAGFEDASRALHEVGPAAVPVVFKKLRHEHPRYGYWHRYAVLRAKAPRFCQRLLPRPRTVDFDEWRACSALVAIGPPVVPSLVKGLSNRSKLVRATCAQALGQFRKIGVGVRAGEPALRAALGDADVTVRKRAAEALGRGFYTERHE